MSAFSEFDRAMMSRALALADRPLRYNAGRNVYEGSVSVGVVENVNCHGRTTFRGM